jgi:predicted ATPase/class 3 adenylate cyclase
MKCHFCAAENSKFAAHCLACGNTLYTLCARCGNANAASNQFCSECAFELNDSHGPSVLQSAASLPRSNFKEINAGERKIVTAMFVDIKGSVELMADLDAEEAQAIIDPALRVMVDVVRSYEGYVVQTTGDGVFALFGAPVAYEDHPRRGIYAALDIQATLRSHAEQLEKQGKPSIEARVGINTGEVVLRLLDAGNRLEYNTIGHAINLAARLQSAAPVGSIAVSESTSRLVEGYFDVRPLPPMPIKGIRGTIPAYEVTGLGTFRRHLQVSIRRGLSKFVGREEEMQRIQNSLDLAMSGRGQIVATITEAGRGKSRLLFEFSRTLPLHCKIIEIYGLPHGKSIPWMPVVDMLQTYFDIRSLDEASTRRAKIDEALVKQEASLLDSRAYLYALLGIAEENDPLSQMDARVRRGRTLEAIKRIILAESVNQPVVLLFEDLHWMDETTESLLDILVHGIAECRVLLLVSSRPDFKVKWSKIDNYQELKLKSLEYSYAEELLSSLLPQTNDLVELKHHIISKSAGNPFFIEEIVQSLFDDGSLRRDGTSSLTKPVVQLRIPQTVQGTLSERIDKLRPPHKELLQTLAVMGPRLPRDLINFTCGGVGIDLDALLGDLEDGDFIYSQPSQSQHIYLFKHVLTLEVAYNSLLSGRRRQLHERVGSSIETIYSQKLGDHVSQLAHHFSRSDNSTKAIHYLGQLGEVAIQRSAHAEAATSLRAAIRLAENQPDNTERAVKESRLWLALGVSLQTSLGYAAEEVRDAYQKATDLSERAGDRFQLVSAIRGHSIFSIVKADYASAFRLGHSLSPIVAQNDEYSAERLLILGLASAYTGKQRDAEKYFKEALQPRQQEHTLDATHYNGHTKAGCLSYLALTEWYLGYPEKALSFSEQALALSETLSIPITTAQSRGMHALLHHTRREYSVAEEWIDNTIHYAAEQGLPYWYTLGSIVNSWLTVEKGNDAGFQSFENGLRDYRASGAKIGLPWLLALRGEILAKGGRLDNGLLAIEEALSCVEETGERYHEAELHRLKGELLMRLNNADSSADSETCFRKSLDIARAGHLKSLELRASISLASLYSRQHRPREGVELLGPVYGWFTEGFNTPDLVDARILLDQMSGASA